MIISETMTMYQANIHDKVNFLIDIYAVQIHIGILQLQIICSCICSPTYPVLSEVVVIVEQLVGKIWSLTGLSTAFFVCQCTM